MGLLNVYNFSKTIKPHLGFRFKVTFFYNKGAEEIESLSYYVKSVELPVWNISTENRQRFGNTQYVIPTFDFGQSTLKIVFLENDNMNVTYFLNGFLFNNVENTHRDANLWNNCAPAILKIKIDELDYSMRNTVVSNIYACHLKRLSTPNFSNTSYGNPVEIEAEFVVRYKLNSLATEVESGTSRVIEEPSNFNEMVINARDTEKQNKEMMDASRKTAALNAEIYTKHNLLSNTQIDELRNKIAGVEAPSEETQAELQLIDKRTELLQANADIRQSDLSNEEKLKLIGQNQELLSEIDHSLASKYNIDLPADETKCIDMSTTPPAEGEPSACDVAMANAPAPSTGGGDASVLLSKISEMQAIAQKEGLIYGHQDYVDTTSMEFKDRSWSGDKSKGIDCSGFATPILAAVDPTIMNYAQTDKKRLNTREIQKYMIEHPELYEEIEVEEGMELKRGDIALRATTEGGTGKDQGRDHILFIDQDVSKLSKKTVVKTAESTGDAKSQVQGSYQRSGSYIINGSTKGGRYKVYRLRQQPLNT